MTGKVRHLVNRKGRSHARLLMPRDLRGVVGKTQLGAPLGVDHRQALRLLPGAVAQFQHQIGLGHYMQRLAFDDELRSDSSWPPVGIYDLLGQRPRAAI